MSLSDAYFPPWLFSYSLVLAASTIGSFLGSWSLHKATTDLRDVSCAIFAIKWFLLYKGGYALARMILTCILMNEFITGESTWAVLDNLHDACGIRLLTLADDFDDQPAPPLPRQNIPLHAAMVSLIAETCNVGACMWMIVIFAELIRLGRRSMDRGERLESRTRRWYMYIISAILTAYFTVPAVLLFTYHRHSDDDRPARAAFLRLGAMVVRLVAFTLQSIAVCTCIFGLFLLRWRGEQVVDGEGQVSHSPLYTRIKRLMIVNLVFLMPYAVAIALMESYGSSGGTLAQSPLSPNVVAAMVGVLSVLNYASGLVFALVLAGSQDCCVSLCMCHPPSPSFHGPNAASLESARAPMFNPVFVNTDIEASSALWGALGPVMHEAQDLHDNLLRSLLVWHNGYEITTAGDAFQLAFHTIPDAIAYCLDVQEQLLVVRWPKALATMDGSRTLIDSKRNSLKRPKYLFHGLRVRMGIHAASDDGELYKQTHPVTHRINYVGLSELIGREVSDLGHGGQIVVTAPVAKWLRHAQDASDPAALAWAEKHPCVLRELGVYRVKDLKIDLGVAYIVPHSVRDRIRFFAPLANVENKDEYTRRASTTYDLLISPKDIVHII